MDRVCKAQPATLWDSNGHGGFSDAQRQTLNLVCNQRAGEQDGCWES